MKNLLFITTLLVGLSACNMADDADYENIAKDLCDCVNKTTEGLSDETVSAMVDADKSGENILEAVGNHFADNPLLAMSDGVIMEKAGEEMESICMKELEEKYEGIYTTSEKESQESLLKALEKGEGCEFTHAIMTLGLQMQ